MHPQTTLAGMLDHRLLDAQEERDLLRRAAAARAAAELLDTTTDASAAAKLMAIIEDGHAARQTVVVHNIRLAHRFASRYRTGTVAFAELFQEALQGVVAAVDRFDPALGYRFTTYATPWIRKHCLELAGRASPVAVPRELTDVVRHAKRLQLTADPPSGEQRWSVQELAGELDVSVGRLQDALAASQPVRSLQAPAGTSDGQDRTLAETLPDQAASVEEQVVSSQLVTAVRELVSELEPRQRAVIAMRFGLDGRSPATLRETAQVLGVHHETVRLTEKDAFARLRAAGVALR